MPATSQSMVEGFSAPGFAGVRAEFERNFADRGEIGAAVCVYRRGEVAVDLWGGIARPTTGAPWRQDTISCMMSVGKSLTALCALMLVDRGAIDLDAPVSRYWPEFAQAGKQAMTVRTLMSGLGGVLYADAAPDDAGLDWAVMVEALAAQPPAWPPGGGQAYHSMSYGFLVGELVRRVDGRSIDRFFAEEVAGPLAVDYHFGLDVTAQARSADLVSDGDNSSFMLMADPSSKLGRAWRILPRLQERANSADFRAGLFPSANGHGAARGVARIYAALAQGGSIGGVRVLSPRLVEALRQQAWAGTCGMTDRHYRYGLGFCLNCSLAPMGPNPRAFGHPGLGGMLAFADPEAELAFAFSSNRICGGSGIGDRCEALVEACYRDLANPAGSTKTSGT
jgi:CubicO group peptidase (beta-lactamase class C family)